MVIMILRINREKSQKTEIYRELLLLLFALPFFAMISLAYLSWADNVEEEIFISS